MAHYTSLYCIMSSIVKLSCHVMSCCIVYYHTLPHHTALHFTILYYTVLYVRVQSSISDSVIVLHLISSFQQSLRHFGFSYYAISYPQATIRHNHYPPLHISQTIQCSTALRLLQLLSIPCHPLCPVHKCRILDDYSIEFYSIKSSQRVAG